MWSNFVVGKKEISKTVMEDTKIRFVISRFWGEDAERVMSRLANEIMRERFSRTLFVTNQRREEADFCGLNKTVPVFFTDG